MAAYAALVSLENLIHDIQNHPSPPISLDKQLLDSIIQHITFFQEFLHAYYNPSHDEEAVDPLEMQIANAAYAAEDAMETHILDTIQQQMSNDAAPKITWILNFFLSAPPKEQIKSINLCRDRLQSVIEEMYLIKKVLARKLNTEEKKKMTPLVPMKNVPASVSREETMVGFQDVSIQIMEKLTGGESNRQVIPIVGMGGIGKTFLATSIYAAPLIREHFDICAWATISQQHNPREILCEILFQATKIKKEQLSEDELGTELHKYLFGRRFLIVLDDMWSIDAWDKIQRFFPHNENYSRVLVTTRLSQLSSQLSNGYSLHVSFLDMASSWDLFSKTVFGDKSCPHELKEIGEKIVDHCRGLPLSIAVVGGLLKKMDANPASWGSIHDNFSSVVNMDNDKHCLRLLKTSYNQLPVYLKPCFLYMGVFKEDDEIRVGPLVRLWISERFLKPTTGEALETTARGFIQDLIDRNLIVIHKLGSTGSIKSCKIHDLLRDLCLKEGQKEGFYHVIGQCRNAPLQGMKTQRRVVIPRNTSNENVGSELMSISHARSIICESSNDYEKKVLPLRNMRLLRILHDYNDKRNSESLTCANVNLRYLNARSSSKFLVSSDVNHIWSLHTLKVDCISKGTSLFTDFWKMHQFRRIEIIDNSFLLPDLPQCGRDSDAIVIMENLHTLKRVSNFKCSEEVAKRIPNIKKLELHYDKDEEDDYFSGNIESLCRLESLFVRSMNSYVHNKLTFPHSLKKLSVFMKYEFEWEDMLEKIVSLPLLEKLKLCGGCFGKGEWETVEGQFSCLKYLKLYGCRGLKNWRAAEEESNILPYLEYLHLTSLYDLEEIPLELGNIYTLKSIEMFNCRERAVKSLKEMVDEQVELQGEEQLSFHVMVELRVEDKHLMSLSGPNFEVRYIS